MAAGVASWSVRATADGWCKCVVAAGVASWSVRATADVGVGVQWLQV